MNPYAASFVALLLTSHAVAQTFSEPPTAVDDDPSPTVFETTLVAAPTTWEFQAGVQTNVWAYNGSIPGPTIQVNVGDTVRIHFQNDLPDETTIHWHGVEAPATVDGSHISQNPIPAGGNYTYEWTASNEGMHWYHPHVRPFDQVEQGLYGVIIIRDPAVEASLGFGALEEHVVVFDDVLLDVNNQIVPAFSFTDPLQNAVYHLNGREGNMLLVNGKDASGVSLQVANAQPLRFRMLNAANTAFCRLDFNDLDTGIDQSVWQVGVDGGFIDKPFRLLPMTSTAPGESGISGEDHPGQALLSQMGQGAFLMPGERMDVVFTPIGGDGETFTFHNNDWYRGRHTAAYGTAGNIVLGVDPLDGLYPKVKLMDLVVQGPDPGTGEFVLPAVLREFPLWVDPPLGNLPFMLGHGDPDPTTGAVTLFAQAEMISGMMSPLPFPKMNSFKAHDIQVGDIWQWEVANLSHGEHPFHAHGFAFELVEYEFQDMLTPENNFFFRPTEKRMFKDTIRVPPRLGAKGSSKTITRLRVHFDDANRAGGVVAHGEQPTFDENGDFVSGGWLAHCHILEHSSKGMLTFFEVRDPADPFHLLGHFHPGTLGNPSLTATGDLTPGSDVTYTLVNAPPNQTVFFVGGNIAASRPFFGGTLVPGVTANGTTVLPTPLFGAVIALSTDGNGQATLTTPAWGAVPAGTKLYGQVAMADPGASNGWSFSNAVLFTRP